MNSEFVGFPLVLETVYPKNRCKVSRSPRSQATSIAWRIALSTLLGVVWKAFATCIFIGWILKPKTIIEEVTHGGHRFGREKLYVVMVKFITPALLTLLLLQALGLIRF